MSLLKLNNDEQFIFDPDLNKISKLMTKTWKKPCWEYTKEALESYIYKPFGDPQMSLGLFVNEDPAGYLCFIPYQVSYKKNLLNVYYGTWWTAGTNFHGRNIALKTMNVMVQEAHKQDAAGIFTVTHKNSIADRANRLTFNRLGESFQLKKTFCQLLVTTKRLKRKVASYGDSPPQLYESADQDRILSLIEKSKNKLDLCQLIHPEAIDYVFRDRPLTRTWVFRDNDKYAFVNVVAKSFLAEQITTNAYVEKANLDSLSAEQAMQFFSSILSDPFCDKIDVFCVPDSGLLQESLLDSLGFTKSHELFNLYCIPFDDQLEGVDINTFCLDIF